MVSRSSSSSSSTLVDDSKRHILSHLPTDSKVLATASAKVYHLPFNARSENWTYSGLTGTLVFGRNRTTVHADKKLGTGPGTSFSQTFWFRLIDPSKGVIWIHEIPTSFDYSLDKPFFHTFYGKSRMFGFRFDDDEDAAKFLKKVTTNVQLKSPSTRKSKRFEHFSLPSKRISPSMISAPAPGTFVHLGHVGFNYKGEIETSDDIEPGWTMMLAELQGYGVTNAVVGGDNDGSPASVKASPLAPVDTNVTPAVAVDPEQAPAKKQRTPVRRKPTVKLT